MKEQKKQKLHIDQEAEYSNKSQEEPQGAADHSDEIMELKKALAEITSKSEDYLESLQRERASFANYKKRIDQENTLVYDNAIADLVRIFLPVVDDLQRALKNKPPDTTIEPWVGGIELILQKLLKTLENKGVTVIEIIPGEEFDPTNQEAVTHEENPEYSDGQVIETVQTGYKLKERIIRPALVRVAK